MPERNNNLHDSIGCQLLDYPKKITKPLLTFSATGLGVAFVGGLAGSEEIRDVALTATGAPLGILIMSHLHKPYEEIVDAFENKVKNVASKIIKSKK